MKIKQTVKIYRAVRLPGTIPSLRTIDMLERQTKRTSSVRVLKYSSYAFLTVLLAIKILFVLVQN